MTRHPITLILILSGAVCIGASAQKARMQGPVIRQVDHILVESGDPKTLFNFFADILQLPQAWPVADNQGFVSGGLGAGNVSLELFRYADRKGAVASRNPAARYAGLALEPYPLENALQELKVRGIPYSPPEPYVSTLPKGSQGILWTTVALPLFSRPGMSVFLYEYNPLFLRVEVRREQLGNRLTLNNGGPLGFQSVREIAIASADLEKDKAAWRRLLGKPSPSGSFPAGKGPAIRLVRGATDRIQEITVAVESLEHARAFLKKSRLLGSSTTKGITLNPSKIQGLRILLVE